MSVIRMLPVRLSPEEAKERSNELAAEVQKLVRMEHEKKEAAKAAKAAIDGLKDRVVELATIVSTKEEYRSVEVIESFDLASKLAREMRVDTAEVVSSRPMTAAEVQEHEQSSLPFGKTKAKDRKTAAAGSS